MDHKEYLKQYLDSAKGYGTYLIDAAVAEKEHGHYTDREKDLMTRALMKGLSAAIHAYNKKICSYQN